jgi:hypothetical protein
VRNRFEVLRRRRVSILGTLQRCMTTNAMPSRPRFHGVKDSGKLYAAMSIEAAKCREVLRTTAPRSTKKGFDFLRSALASQRSIPHVLRGKGGKECDGGDITSITSAPSNQKRPPSGAVRARQTAFPAMKKAIFFPPI